MITLTTYRFLNALSGMDLGTYQAGSREDALDAFAHDAGYPSYAQIPDECSGAGLVVEEVS